MCDEVEREDPINFQTRQFKCNLNSLSLLYVDLYA